MQLYEITLEQSYYGQQIINRWNYVADAIPSGVNGSFKLIVGMGFAPDTDITAWGDGTVGGELRPLQNANVHFIQCIAKNLYSVTDFFTYAFPPGTNGQSVDPQGLPPISAMGFTSDKTRADIRRAQKRFVGLNEPNVDSGGVLNPDFATQAQLIGDAMGDINVVPAGTGAITYTPYVFGRHKYHPVGKTTWAYEYYETQAEQEEHIAKINAFILKPEVRSQTSRQYGRGS